MLQTRDINIKGDRKNGKEKIKSSKTEAKSTEAGK